MKFIQLFCLIFLANMALAGEKVSQTADKPMSEDDLELFASWISGGWDNVAQVEREIRGNVSEGNRHDRLAMYYTEVVTPDVRGRTFAIENYSDGEGFAGELTRISLHRFMLSEAADSIIHEFMFLKDKALLESLAGNLNLLSGINEDDFSARVGCRMYWHWQGDRFEGRTKKGACVTNSFTDRTITVEGHGILEPNRILRHDRNYEMTGEEIPRRGYKSEEIFNRVSKPGA